MASGDQAGPGIPRAPSSFSSPEELDDFADRLVRRRQAGRSAKNAATDRWKKLKTAIAFSSRVCARTLSPRVLNAAWGSYSEEPEAGNAPRVCHSA